MAESLGIELDGDANVEAPGSYSNCMFVVVQQDEVGGSKDTAKLMVSAWKNPIHKKSRVSNCREP